MKHLFILRHGEQDEKGNLSENGKEQMKRLAYEIKAILGENYSNCCIISSREKRVRQSSKSISDILRTDICHFDDALEDNLCSQIDEKAKFQAIDDLIDKYGAKFEAVALLTHKGVAGPYVDYIYKVHHNRYIPFKWLDTGKGYHMEPGKWEPHLIPAL